VLILKIKVYIKIFAVAFLCLALTGCAQTKKTEAPETLFIYCGSGLSKPVQEIGEAFEKRTGTEVTFTFGGSAQLAGQILLTRKGNLFIPGDLKDLAPVEEKGLINKKANIVYHIPALAVPKSNPAGIHGLMDLKLPGVKVALGDPKSCTIGKVADTMLQENQIYDDVEKNVVVRTATARELVLYLSTGQVDAAVIWKENIINCKDKIELIPVPELDSFTKIVPAAILTFSEQKEAAEQFLNFLNTEESKEIWNKWGYQTVER